jgi:apolipoprotein N-acyltransferase
LHFLCSFVNISFRVTSSTGNYKYDRHALQLPSKQITLASNMLPKSKQAFIALAAFFIVAFGQPAWNWVLALISAICGFALFWRILLYYPNTYSRFWLSTIWFTAVQLVQLSWLISHPYWYIYGVYFALSFGLGLQFGFLGILFHPDKIYTISQMLFISATWTIIEWSRLFFLSGFTWNSVGMALSGNVISLQTASLAGIYGLSFIVILTNLLALKAWLCRFRIFSTSLWLTVTLFPYFYGGLHYLYHNQQMTKNKNFFETILVQTGFPAEEALNLKSYDEWLEYVLNEWILILQITKSFKTNKEVDLLALPEAVVPFGTYSFVYPYEKVKAIFQSIYGEECLKYLPPLEIPLAISKETDKKLDWLVNNAFWAQALANYFDTTVVAGLEDAEDVAEGIREHYAAAICFKPQSHNPNESFTAFRYAKRVLVPMGEYIPFNFFKSVAAHYGILGSFTAGKKTEIWNCKNVPIGISICYEETFGNLMRENRLHGAEILLNLTSDVWYPNSRLARQHLEHARLRTVESGIPLIRSCNTGITCAVNSLGRDIAVLGENDNESQKLSGALRAAVPLYTYFTLYSLWGDMLIVALCCLLFLLKAWFK